MTNEPSRPELTAELKDLRARLAGAEEALRAIRTGNVDAVLVTGEGGERVYTLRGADRIYRQLIETMSEGAATLSAGGVILYCNVRLAEMLGQPLDQVLGTALRNYLPPADQQALDAILAQARTEPSRREINLKSGENRLVPVHVSASRLPSEEAQMVFCLVLTDLTEQKSHEQIVTAERLARSILEQAAEAIVVCDEQGRVIRASQAAQRFCDGSPLLRPFAEVLPLRTGASDPFHLAPVLGGETLRDVDVTLDRQGQTLALILNAGPLKSGQQILGCVVTLTDITERKRSEDALAESQRELEAILDAAADGILLAETESGRFQSANASICRMLGYSQDEMLDLGVSDIFRKEDLAHAAQEFERRVKGDTAIPFGLLLKRKDGSTFFADINSAPVMFGDKACLVGIFRDVTERKRAEEALRESEARYRRFIEMAQEGFGETDLAGRIVSVNVRLNQMFGYTLGEMIGLNIVEDLVFPEDRAEIVERLQARSQGKAVTYEQRFRKKTGEPMWLNVSGAPITNANGVVLGSFAMMTDITERERVEGTLRLQSAALNAAANAIIITGRNGTIEWINAAFTSLTGYSAEEAIGRNPRELVKSGVHDQAFYKHLWETILAGNVWRGEMTNRRKDGSLYPEEQTITPVKNDRGEIAHFIAIKQDLTEQHRLEAQFLQSQKMETVGQLAGGIAHDFNNLLTVINGTAELVLDQVSQDDQVRADVQEIFKAGERAAVLTRQLLAFSRQQILESRVLSLNTVVAGMGSLLHRLLGEDIDLVIVPTPGLGSVKADLGQIEQVISNLAVNARDAMPQGGRLTIETENVTIDENYARQHGVTMPLGSYVLLAVSDSGAGMDEATRVRIFEPFFTTKGPGKGTGLGLSTAYGIVKQSHGFIWVYSEVGQGTSFKIYLPQVIEAVGPDLPGPAVVSISGTETLLLAEDNAGLRTLATRVLEPAGYTVLGAATGEEALRLLEGRGAPVHLLLSDVVMPGMSGRHLAERLAQTHPETKVLYMSGYTSDTIVQHGVLEAQVPFLAKPFTAAALLRKVREVLDS